MRFKIFRPNEEWHPKFLWAPMILNEKIIWLETVERRWDPNQLHWVDSDLCMGCYDYRIKENKNA